MLLLDGIRWQGGQVLLGQGSVAQQGLFEGGPEAKHLMQLGAVPQGHGMADHVAAFLIAALALQHNDQVIQHPGFGVGAFPPVTEPGDDAPGSANAGQDIAYLAPPFDIRLQPVTVFLEEAVQVVPQDQWLREIIALKPRPERIAHAIKINKDCPTADLALRIESIEARQQAPTPARGLALDPELRQSRGGFAVSQLVVDQLVHRAAPALGLQCLDRGGQAPFFDVREGAERAKIVQSLLLLDPSGGELHGASQSLMVLA